MTSSPIWHNVYERKFNVGCSENVVDVYNAIISDMKNIAHVINSVPSFTTNIPNTNISGIDFLIPDEWPLTIVGLYGKACISEADTEVSKCIGLICLDIKHLQEKDYKFPKLEEIAIKHGLSYITTCEDYSIGHRLIR